MNETRFPDMPPPSPPPPAPQPEPPGQDGSLALGVGLAWVIKVVGSIIVALIALSFMAHTNWAIWPMFVFGSIPLLVSIGLAIWMILKGPKRTGIGILIGIGTIWAVQVLLVAACFGILFAASGH